MNKKKNLKESMQRENDALRNSTKGITLIALVITIVVLLILAAVSITAVFGDNGLLKQASEASVKTKLSTVEELANEKYATGVFGEYLQGQDKTTIEDAMEYLEQRGYEIERRLASGEEITGIKLDKETISMAPNETQIINVTYVTNSSGGTRYYVKVDGKYYRIIDQGNGVTVERRETKLTEEESPELKEITATVKDGTSVTVEGVEGKTITIKSGEAKGKTTITVKYGEGTGEYEKDCEVTVAIKPTEDSEEVSSTTFSTAYGRIDVIWLNTDNTIRETPNEPILSAKSDAGKDEAMTPVTWTFVLGEGETEEDRKAAGTWEEDKEVKSNWYSYEKAEGTEDTKESQWANAKTANESYFVWIPRYAYRITYYDKDWTQDDTAQVTGYYDGWGMWKAEDGALKYKIDEGIKTVEYKGDKYIVHPAFMDNRENNFDNGGWDKDLAGFWFAKYEMSGNKSTVQTDSKELKSVPSVSSLVNINIGVIYQACRNATYGYDGQSEKVIAGGLTDTDKKDHTSYMSSHLMKNSEWGAVAYLTHSIYGRNGHEIDINNSSGHITGNGGGGTATSSKGGIINAYNTEKGAHASTTGNIYGIYDMSGGENEYAASYDKLGDSKYLTGSSYGLDLTKEAKSNTLKTEDGSDYEYISTKYATAYEYSSDVYEVSKTGDAVKEVIDWFKDYSVVCDSSRPFFGRSGSCSRGAGAGVFFSDNGVGGNDYSYGFRAVLCP